MVKCHPNPKVLNESQFMNTQYVQQTKPMRHFIYGIVWRVLVNASARNAR